MAGNLRISTKYSFNYFNYTCLSRELEFPSTLVSFLLMLSLPLISPCCNPDWSSSLVMEHPLHTGDVVVIHLCCYICNASTAWLIADVYSECIVPWSITELSARHSVIGTKSLRLTPDTTTMGFLYHKGQIIYIWVVSLLFIIIRLQIIEFHQK